MNFWQKLYLMFGLGWLAVMTVSLWAGQPLGVRFETNDDYWMFQIASGRYTGQPSEFLLYIHPCLGWLVATGYRLLPHVNWYAMMLFLLHAVFVGAVMYCIWPLAKSFVGLALILGTFGLFHGFVFYRIQFTTTAFVTATAALIVWMASLRHATDAKRGRLVAAASFGSWVLAWCLRKEAAFLALILCLPMAYWIACRTRHLRRLAIHLLVLLAVTGAVEIADKAYISRYPEWVRFLRFNRYRGRIHVSPGFSFDSGSASVYRCIGWSENDVRLFQQWFFPEPHVHSMEHVEYLVRQLRRPLGLWEAIRAWLSTLRSRRFDVIAAMCLLAGVVLLRTQVSGPVVLCMLVAAALQLYLQATARLPPRVLLPLLYGPFLGALPAVAESNSAITARWVRRWILCLLCLLGLSTRRYTKLKHEHDQMLAAWQRAEQEETRVGGRVLVIWGDDWPVEWSRVRFRVPPDGAVRRISLSSLTQSPHYWEVLRQEGTTNLVEALLCREDWLLACRPERLPLFERYVREHLNRDLRVEEVGGIFQRRICRLMLQ